MTKGARTTVEGADTFARSLGDTSTDLADIAPYEAAALIRDRSRAAAPFVSGRLRASITGEVSNGIVSVQAGAEYAGVIHNGWAAHNIRANPFLIPVAEDLSSVWGDYYETETARVCAADVKGA